jgi:hypothetical protein
VALRPWPLWTSWHQSVAVQSKAFCQIEDAVDSFQALAQLLARGVVPDYVSCHASKLARRKTPAVQHMTAMTSSNLSVGLTDGLPIHATSQERIEEGVRFIVHLYVSCGDR